MLQLRQALDDYVDEVRYKSAAGKPLARKKVGSRCVICLLRRMPNKAHKCLPRDGRLVCASVCDTEALILSSSCMSVLPVLPVLL